MSIGVTINENEGIVEIVYSSGIDEAHLPEERRFVAEILLERKIEKVFVDASCSTSDLSFNTIREHAEALYSENFRKVTFALVIPELNAKFGLLESLTVHNGGHLKCFTARKEALAWLSNCFKHSNKQVENIVAISN